MTNEYNLLDGCHDEDDTAMKSVGTHHLGNLS